MGAGGLALLPRGLAHGFVVTSAQARFLTLHTPSGFDRFVAEVGAAAEAPGPDELTRLAAAHGIRIVGPPLRPRPAQAGSGTAVPLTRTPGSPGTRRTVSRLGRPRSSPWRRCTVASSATSPSARR